MEYFWAGYFLAGNFLVNYFSTEYFLHFEFCHTHVYANTLCWVQMANDVMLWPILMRHDHSLDIDPKEKSQTFSSHLSKGGRSHLLDCLHSVLSNVNSKCLHGYICSSSF